MPCHLKVAPLSANSRANHDLWTVVFQKPRRLPIPLNGPHRLVKTRDLAFWRDQRLVKGLDLGAVGAQHQHFLTRMLRQKISEPTRARIHLRADKTKRIIASDIGEKLPPQPLNVAAR